MNTEPNNQDTKSVKGSFLLAFLFGKKERKERKEKPLRRNKINFQQWVYHQPYISSIVVAKIADRYVKELKYKTAQEVAQLLGYRLIWSGELGQYLYRKVVKYKIGKKSYAFLKFQKPKFLKSGFNPQ